MYHNNCIQVSLDLKDINFYFDSIFLRRKCHLYNPLAYPCCGIKNEDYSIIKWRSVSYYPTYFF